MIFGEILAEKAFFCQNGKCNLKKIKLNDCGGFQLPKVKGEISKKLQIFYNWFSMCNKKNTK